MRLGAALFLAAFGFPAMSQEIVSAQYTQPTERYAHGILGDAIEHAGLRVVLTDGTTQEIVYPDGMVFEDTNPRVIDLDFDGAPEVIVVETHAQIGARLAVWGMRHGKLSLLAHNDHIGRAFRWLSVVGAADMDGDGMMEIAYVDRPHLAKQLMVWRYGADGLTLVATKDGLTNHRIGERDIGGGMRVCGDQVEVITASADWSRVKATTLRDGKLTTRDIGPHEGRASLAAALVC